MSDLFDFVDEDLIWIGDGWAGWVGYNAPVEGEGIIDNHPWAFYARGAYWGLEIAEDPRGNPMDVECGVARGWSIEGQIGPADGNGASWLAVAEVRALIAEHFARWRKGEYPLINSDAKK